MDAVGTMANQMTSYFSTLTAASIRECVNSGHTRSALSSIKFLISDCNLHNVYVFRCSVVSNHYLQPYGCGLPCSSVHEILLTRTLEWDAISSSRDFPHPGIKTQLPTVCICLSLTPAEKLYLGL